MVLGVLREACAELRAMSWRQMMTQFVSLGLILTSALAIWKGLMLYTGSESPVVVVLSGSMEPGFSKGDILFLHRGHAPVHSGEVVVFHIDERDVPIVHRVVRAHERSDSTYVELLTKGTTTRAMTWPGVCTRR